MRAGYEYNTTGRFLESTWYYGNYDTEEKTSSLTIHCLLYSTWYETWYRTFNEHINTVSRNATVYQGSSLPR